MKKIGILGSGAVAKALAAGFIKHGYAVRMGSRSPEKLADWAGKFDESLKAGSFAEAADFGDIIVLAVAGKAASEVIELSDFKRLAGKTVIDTTNPIGDQPPENGVIRYFTDGRESLMERLQSKYPDINFVKAFNSVGNSLMVDPQFKDGKPTMFICGNNTMAKQQVTGILTEFNWETEDMGSVEAAGSIESLCILWCIPGFLRNEWTHAFKLLKK